MNGIFIKSVTYCELSRKKGGFIHKQKFVSWVCGKLSTISTQGYAVFNA
jgi:hypothetical protein